MRVAWTSYPVDEIEALVVSKAVLVKVTCQDEEVALISLRVTVDDVDSILTPGVVVNDIHPIVSFIDFIYGIR